MIYIILASIAVSFVSFMVGEWVGWNRATIGRKR
jgi:hypothetical protein